jgi:FecR protein
MKSNKELDTILDQAAKEIRSARVDETVVEQAAERVWARVAAVKTVSAAPAATVERIEGCSDFQSLIPAYLSGKLSEARSLLLVDHTHECIPCRRALKAARSHEVAPPQPAAPRRFHLQPVILRWGVAAMLVVGLGLLAVPLMQRYLPFGSGLEATVQAAEGQVYKIADQTTAPVGNGAKLLPNDRLRTARDGHALVRLGDGSVIEMRGRSELALTSNGLGTTVHLERGSIIVEAARQKSRQLFVDTGDSLISVKGTVFSVNNGTKGARVSVVEGEVHLDHAGKVQVLRAGEQATTSNSIDAVPVKDEIAWSQNAARYASTLAGLAALNPELGNVARPGARTSTHLLDLMPDNTVFYAALPNLTETLAQSQRIMLERINQNPALRAWWDKKHEAGKGANVDQMMVTFRDFGAYLGEEIAVSLQMDQNGEPTAPLVLAELKDASGFRRFLEQQISLHSTAGSGHQDITFVDDPLTTPPAAPADGKGHDGLYVWITSDMVAASPRLDALQGLATRSRQATPTFAADPFRERIAQVYHDGAGLIVAANLERILAGIQNLRTADAATRGQQQEQALQQLGVTKLKYFVLDQNDSNGKTLTRAVLSFNEAQRGIPSWLAAPGPMGSLEYISPDANVVAGFVVKDPSALVDDLMGVLSTVAPDLRNHLSQLQADHGLDIRRDFAAPLGGEFAFAIDGPILPTPSWKMIFEVNDPSHLQQTLETVVGEINKEAARAGKGGLVWDKGDLNGRTFYTLKSADFGVEVNYTFANGYWIVGPSRALVERAISLQQSGSTLLRSPRFIAGLPADGHANFSALVYHDLAPLVRPFADRLAKSANNLPDGSQEAIKAMAADLPPTLAYAYATNDSITVAANTDGGPFGLSPASLLGMPNAFEIQHILQNGLKPGATQK